LIHSGIKTKVTLPFKEEDVSLLDEVRDAPDSMLARKYTREEDYALYKYWGVKPSKVLEKALRRTHSYLKAHLAELKEEKNTEYVASLIKEFEGVRG
jgi:hypothetical protein